MAFQEIEVKILEIDRDQVEKRLLELGGVVSFDGEMTAWFFDTPDRQIKDRGDVLRLRKEGENSVLTYKKHISMGEAKVMEETETLVDDPEKMSEILMAAGFEVIKHTRKFRKEYALHEAHVVIDNYQDELGPIPEFIEVEAENMEVLKRVVEGLGFGMDQCLNWSTRELVKHYLK
ncbi:MAG: class IV adenylate cyclase [Bacteroidia bacterium]|nr:class IV adenylate cyclase [Bacteroidia bacterium]